MLISKDRMISGVNLLRAVFIELHNRGYGEKKEDGKRWEFPLGEKVVRNLHNCYYLASKNFKEEMDEFDFVKRCHPYCSDLEMSIQDFRMCGMTWFDDGTHILEGNALLDILDSKTIQNYDNVKKVASFIVDNLQNS